MKYENVIFVIENVSAKTLRQIHQCLAQKFKTVKVIERMMDIAFTNISDYNLVIGWAPADRGKTETFIRNVRLRSKTIPIHFFCPKESLMGIAYDREQSGIKQFQIVKCETAQEIAEILFQEYNKPENSRQGPSAQGELNNLVESTKTLVIAPNTPIADFLVALTALEQQLKAQYHLTPEVFSTFESLEKTLSHIEKTALNDQKVFEQTHKVEQSEEDLEKLPSQELLHTRQSS